MLGDYKSDVIRDRLLDCASDESELIPFRSIALLSLGGQIPSKETSELLRNILIGNIGIKGKHTYNKRMETLPSRQLDYLPRVAALALGKQKDQEAHPLLIKMALDPNQDFLFRSACWLSLSEFGNFPFNTIMKKMEKEFNNFQNSDGSKQFFLESFLIAAAKNIKEDSDLTPLKQLAFTQRINTKIRYMAIILLGLSKQPNTVEDLINLLNDQNTFIRLTSATAIATLDPDNILAKKTLISEMKRQYIPWIHKAYGLLSLGLYQGADIESILKQALTHPENLIRKNSLASLGKQTSETSTNILVKNLDVKDPYLITETLKSLLDRPRDEILLKKFRKLSHHYSFHVRRLALISLENQYDKTSLQTLINSLNDSHWEVREAAVFSLAFSKHQNTLKAL